MMKCIRLVAQELSEVRLNPPKTIGDALPAYAEALERARKRGAEPAVLLLVGELLWSTIRPEAEPAPDEIGAWLEKTWERYGFPAEPDGKRPGSPTPGQESKP